MKYYGSRAQLQEKAAKACFETLTNGDKSTPLEQPDRAHFLGLSESERRKFPERWREAVLLCSRQGEVKALYANTVTGDLLVFAEEFRIGEPVWEAFPQQVSADCQMTFSNLADSTHREYAVSLPDGREYACEAIFQNYPQDETVGLFLRDSIFEEVWIRFRPNVVRTEPYTFEAAPFVYSLKTNALGWRDDPVQAPKPPGVYRILCIGGSTTVEGPRNDLTYPNLIERLLRENPHRDSIEVINCGVIGFSSPYELQRVPDFIALEPDLIVHYNFVNDLNSLIPSWLSRDDSPGRIRVALSRMAGYSLLTQRVFKKWILPPRDALYQLIDSETMSNMAEMVKAFKEAGVSVAVCSFSYPDLDRANAEEKRYWNNYKSYQWLPHGELIDMRLYKETVDTYNAKVRNFCQQQGLIYIPVAETLNADTLAFVDLCHLGLPGILHKAQIICETLAQKLPELTQRD